MLSRANLAASNITSVVVSRISEFKPPMIPASATGFLPSQITRLFSLKQILSHQSNDLFALGSTSYADRVAFQIIAVKRMTADLTHA